MERGPRELLFAFDRVPSRLIRGRSLLTGIERDACQSLQWIYGLRCRNRAADSALSAHLREEAGRRLVRDHFGELHGGRWPSAAGAGPDSGPVSRCAARRFYVLRLRAAVEP